jgi:hypothetical protein
VFACLNILNVSAVNVGVADKTAKIIGWAKL